MLIYQAFKSCNFVNLYKIVNEALLDLEIIENELNYFGSSIFNYMCKYDYFAFIDFLVDNTNVNVNYEISHKTPLINSIEKRDIEMVKVLLKSPNINVNSFIQNKNEIKINGLMIAVSNNDIEIIKLLLDNPNIDINSKSIIINENGNEEEETVLIRAIKNENIEIPIIKFSN